MREDWIEIELGKIAQIYNGNSVNSSVKEEKYQVCKTGLNYIGTKDIAFNGTIDYENGVKIPFDEPKFKIAPKNCILVCSEGGSAGKKTAFTNENICFGNKLYAIVNKYSAFEGKYIFYYTRYRRFFESFKEQMNGIIGGVSIAKFSNIPISLAPVLEQKAIVAKIEQLFSELDKGIESLKTAQAKLKIYRQAVLKKAFDGDYKLVEIGDVCDVFVGATPSRKNANYWGGDIYWVSSGEVKFNTINTTKEKITEEGLKNTSTVIHPPQTILLAMIGEGKTRGQCAILNVHAAHNQNTAALRAKKEFLDFRFLYNFLVYTYEDTRRIGSGNNQKALNKARVSALTLPLPTIEEQNQIIQEIESRLSVCDKIEQTISDALTKAEALRQSILKKAFEGKLLDAQELEAIQNHPEYESAEKLLQRIKLERAK